LPEGFKTSCLAGLQDILPTLCSLVGAPLEAAVDGQDLTPVITRQGKVRDYYVSQCNTADPDQPQNQIYMITDGVWKYIYTVYGGIEELYDCKTDARESHNLAAALAAKTEAFRNLLWKWCLDNGDLEMLDGKQLLKIAKSPAKPPVPANPFGRRFY
jgi:arylsulfatase A-like enzyme